MTSSYTPTNVAQGFGQETAINSNFTDIKTALDESKSRVNSTSESMSVDLDMNSNDVLNVASLDAAGITLSGEMITTTNLATVPIPAQVGNADKVLKTNGSVLSWDLVETANIGDAALTSLGDLFTAADKMVYTTASDTYATTDLTPLARTVLGSTTAITASRNYIDGLETFHGADADHDVRPRKGVCMDSTNTIPMVYEESVLVTKQIDVDWQVSNESSLKGGFPSGLTLLPNTWYHFFILAKTDGTVDFGWDDNIFAVNLLVDATGYPFFRRIAAHLTDASSNIIPFLQNGDNFRWQTAISDVNNINPGTTAILTPVSTPKAVRSMARLSVDILDATPSGTTHLLFTSPDEIDVTPTTTSRTLATSVSSIGAQTFIEMYTDLGSKIRYRLSQSTTDHTVQIRTLGYTDPRGKESQVL